MATLKLRLRIARLSGSFLSDDAIALLVGAALGPDHQERPDPDGAGYLFRCFEEDVDL